MAKGIPGAQSVLVGALGHGALDSVYLLVSIQIVVLRMGALVFLEQLLGHTQRHLALYKGMLEQPLGGWSLLWILCQCGLDEAVKRWAPLLFVAQ